MSADSDGESILVVDDEESVLTSFCRTLKSAGFPNVMPCSDGRKVEGIVEKHSISLILLDLNMPHMPISWLTV